MPTATIKSHGSGGGGGGVLQISSDRDDQPQKIPCQDMQELSQILTDCFEYPKNPYLNQATPKKSQN